MPSAGYDMGGLARNSFRTARDQVAATGSLVPGLYSSLKIVAMGMKEKGKQRPPARRLSFNAADGIGLLPLPSSRGADEDDVSLASVPDSLTTTEYTESDAELMLETAHDISSSESVGQGAVGAEAGGAAGGGGAQEMDLGVPEVGDNETQMYGGNELGIATLQVAGQVDDTMADTADGPQTDDDGDMGGDEGDNESENESQASADGADDGGAGGEGAVDDDADGDGADDDDADGDGADGHGDGAADHDDMDCSPGVTAVRRDDAIGTFVISVADAADLRASARIKALAAHAGDTVHQGLRRYALDDGQYHHRLASAIHAYAQVVVNWYAGGAAGQSTPFCYDVNIRRFTKLRPSHQIAEVSRPYRAALKLACRYFMGNLRTLEPEQLQQCIAHAIDNGYKAQYNSQAYARKCLAAEQAAAQAPAVDQAMAEEGDPHENELAALVM